MRIDGFLGGLEQAAGTARAAQDVGYDGVWATEVNQDPFLPLSLAAAATSTIQIGTSIAVALSRSPMSLAYTAHDLARFSGGRLVLGLGSQVRAHVTRRFSMPWGRPGPQLREFVLAMRAAWSSWADGTPLAFEGEYYQHTLMPPTFVPVPNPAGPPPVWLAAVGEVMCRVAGEVADGMICHGFSTPRWLRERTLPALAEGRRRAGAQDGFAGFEVVAHPFVVTGTDEEMAAGLAAVRRRISFYGSTPAYRAVLDLHGWGELGTELTALSRQNRWAEMAALVGDEVVDAFTVVAAPRELAARLADRYGGLVTRLSFTPPASLDRDASHGLISELRAIPALGAQHDPTRAAAPEPNPGGAR
ncbi:conserved hypothetical protein [Frankia canadensis]|uniref:Luciferase-like domain-containing protein n=1 Tax=Frankia canadensis TaxID=1836972 RepID=A0A2I2L0T2_9ACTN|nr:TIGR03617 family F420-dependent LLM class oxidoreductase [Frankia canadensis]SNQ51531.1 conserved hypothetical protein [Frankia canadensis]SOU58821.1 conserved hypothetical protein [Frankia canadensis]